MTRAAKPHRPLPSKDELARFIRAQPGRVGKREIARAFQLAPADRPALRDMLKELADDGAIERGRKRRFAEPGALPEVTVIEIREVDSDGELIGAAVAPPDEDNPARNAVRIEVRPDGRKPALGRGDRVLCRLRKTGGNAYEARIIKRLPGAPGQVLGVLADSADGLRLRPTDRKQKHDYLVADTNGIMSRPGDLVLAEVLPARRLGLRTTKLIDRFGHLDDPRAISLIAIHSHGIPRVFPADAVSAAERAEAAPLGTRTDLRHLPLVTIDGADARDFDDAVFAEPDNAADNRGGFRICVAIADVSWYVRPGSALDRAARERGNSVYFPDRVVPMLPEALSNGWCSLVPQEDRPCVAVFMRIDAHGNPRDHRFCRGLMRSAARLTYEQVQSAIDGHPDETAAPLMDNAIVPLFGAYRALDAARQARGSLDLDLPERQILIGEDGHIDKVVPRRRYDSHKLIELFMIAANVAAATELERRGKPVMYRVHDRPAEERLKALKDFLRSLDIKLPASGGTSPADFNRVLDKVKGSPHEHLVNTVVLRAQSQAEYSPDNLGHFGLGLDRYAHFTSPIRRYADLLVHRALVSGLKPKAGALSESEAESFAEIGQHISMTERRAASAERDAVDRFTVAFLADRVGAVFSARISGVARFGLFVTLDETGADGLVPIRSLPDDYYHLDEVRHCLRGDRTDLTFRLGDPLEVELVDAMVETGSMTFTIAAHAALDSPRPGRNPAKSTRKPSPGGKSPSKARGGPKKTASRKRQRR